ncbi:MAB_1171c family putative transporter [Streptomyces sp. NPDC001068]|uniref:MAB_1171c family putative transporter n=1 Tax=Streptomyces sp. NPDC001068 TaxID=3364544 RepID=UPI00367A950C
MSTDDLIDLFTTIPLWVVVAVRTYYWPKTPGKRAILATFTALTVGATLRLAFIDDALARLFHFKDAAVLPKHLCVMLASILLVGWLKSVVPPRDKEPAWLRWIDFKPRMVFVAVMSIAASAVFPYVRPSITAPDGSPDFASAQYGDVAGTVHLAAYLLTMGVALAPSAVLCLTVARRTDDRLLRVCMRLMAAGAAAGAFYPVYRIAFLICGFTHWTFPLNEAEFHRGGSLIQLVTILFIIVGSSVRAVEIVLRAVRMRRALIDLRPLWAELVSVLPPDVIKRRFQEPTGALADRYTFTDLYGRLDARIVDISDAAFELLPWVEEDLPGRALEEARTAGLSGGEAEAAKQALCLRVARQRAVDGEPHARTPAVSLLSLRDDLASNTRWLARVARHYASPAFDDAANRLAGHLVLQEATA